MRDKLKVRFPLEGMIKRMIRRMIKSRLDTHFKSIESASTGVSPAGGSP
jgi:hypothetical protein